LSEYSEETRSAKSQRGSEEESAEPRFLVIGRIVKPHGVRGEMRVDILTELPERFEWLEAVYIGDKSPTKHQVESVRFHKSSALLKLSGCDDRDAVNQLRSQLIQIPESEGLPLEEGEYYLHQLINLRVETEEGEYLGIIKEVIETKANNVFVVKGSGPDILLPDIDEVIRDIDFEDGIMTVRLMEGLIS
jgi:16S rRNA processing protein RimM